MDHIAIVGAGQAGATASETLRKRGYEGRITLWGAEDAPPYQRPPLSKAYLLGDTPRERLFLRPAAFWDEKGIEMRLGTPVAAIDPDARTLTHEGGAEAWDALILATGARPHHLPHRCTAGLDGVHVIRTLADIDALRPVMTPDKALLVVGGGYIGLEAAAVARKLGLPVTLVELNTRVLARVACKPTAAWFRALHRDRGVDLREGIGLDTLTGEGHVSGARLTDGTEVRADVVVAGIGAAPDTALAEAAGLAIDDGIAVDDHGRTSADGVWAAGDCASFPWRGGRLRLESVGNAIEMAEAVAANILGADAPYRASPWFWSDQYDTKLQIAGWNAGYDEIVTRNGGSATSHWYYDGGDLLAVDAIDAPRDYMVGKRLIEAGRSPDKDALRDPETDLKALLRA